MKYFHRRIACLLAWPRPAAGMGASSQPIQLSPQLTLDLHRPENFVKLLFVHGWGFDASIWNLLAPMLSDCERIYHERGYFLAPGEPFPTERCIAVTHSFGAMRVLADPPTRCAGLIAINGFDRFTACDGQVGVDKRVVNRMLDRLVTDPATLLVDFYHRCGAHFAQDEICFERLHHDLTTLRDEDRTNDSKRWNRPILSLQGSEDPILPVDLRTAAFATARDLKRETRTGGGHLLPITDPSWCANAIHDFVARLERDN